MRGGRGQGLEGDVHECVCVYICVFVCVCVFTFVYVLRSFVSIFMYGVCVCEGVCVCVYARMLAHEHTIPKCVQVSLITSTRPAGGTLQC